MAKASEVNAQISDAVGPSTSKLSLLASINSLLPLLIPLITVSIPALYIIGYYYDYGYLSIFGLSNDFFPRSVHGYLISAFNAFTQLALFLAVTFDRYFLYLLAALVLVLFGIGVKHYVKHKLAIKKPVEKIDVKEGSALGDIIFTLEALQKIAIAFLLPFTFILFGLISYLGGIVQAKEKIETFSDCDIAHSPTDRCIFIRKNNRVALEGLLVAKSPTDIALWDGEKTIVYPLTDETIEIRLNSLSQK